MAISLKALVEKRSNKVIFIESDNDFVDVLFSFLTIPMGTIIRLACKHSVPLEIGCIKNLYASVENADKRLFQTEGCREMLLRPRNGVQSHCENLKLKINNGDPTRYFLCSKDCTRRNKLFSHYKDVLCECGEPMNREISLSVGKLKSSSPSNGGVFCKGLTRFIISDDLEVMPPVNSAVSSFLTKVGVTDANSTDEMTLNVGFDEVLNLLICSFVSKTPLTDILLKHKPEPNLNSKGVTQGICFKGQTAGETMNEEKNISINLMVSKSKKIICYAEAGEDFVNLLFSFLTVPLGFILKEMQDSSSSTKGCIDQLYKSVQDLDEHYLKSNYHKEILLSPKLYPGFGDENHLLGIEGASYYYAYYWSGDGYQEILTNDKTLIPYNMTAIPLKLKYCKSLGNYKSDAGFLSRPAMFTITDSLMIRPISPLFGVSVLNELKVQFADIEMQTVQVGKEE
ncbi:uncharacterized protein LOC110746970, partial [Prunus avium]|uniref:Uncharacterized protein LOC110746970 n=1 Tax=Prunus avium TaxID=42229 RepID=A0A6P5RJE1_PRUAV